MIHWFWSFVADSSGSRDPRRSSVRRFAQLRRSRYAYPAIAVLLRQEFSGLFCLAFVPSRVTVDRLVSISVVSFCRSDRDSSVWQFCPVESHSVPLPGYARSPFSGVIGTLLFGIFAQSSRSLCALRFAYTE